MEQPQVHEETHPGPRKYVVIAAILMVVTALEVGLFYLDFSPAFLAALILLSSAVKFAIVVGYYMHLRFDNWRFLALFAFPFFIAVGIMVALLTLFGNLTR